MTKEKQSVECGGIKPLKPCEPIEKRPNHRPPKARKIDEPLDRDYFTIYEVADLLGLHHNTIRRAIKAEELPAKKYRRVWRIRKTDLEKYTQV